MSFAPYQPAPDDPPPTAAQKGKQKAKQAPRPWFNSQASSYTAPSAPSSYQGGAVPSFGAVASVSSQDGPSGPVAGGAGAAEAATNANAWETRYGWRVDALAAWCYLLGPITALIILILETHNDYVRFHAYQSALSITPLFLIHLILGLSGAPNWLRWIWFIAEIAAMIALATRAYRDANEGGLARYRLPYVGEWADAWVGDE